MTHVAAFAGAGTHWERPRPIPREKGVSPLATLLSVQSAKAYPDEPCCIGQVGLSLGNGYMLEAPGKAHGGADRAGAGNLRAAGEGERAVRGSGLS